MLPWGLGVAHDKFHFGVRYQFVRQFLTEYAGYGTKIKIAVMDAHRRSVATFVEVIVEGLDNIGLAVVVGIAEGSVSPEGIGKPQLYVDVAVSLYGKMPGTALQAIDHDHRFEASRQKKPAIVRISRRQFWGTSIKAYTDHKGKYKYKPVFAPYGFFIKSIIYRWKLFIDIEIRK